MTREMFDQLRSHMLHMLGSGDSSHDCQHVYRVLYQALRLTEHYEIDRDVLIAACLLHDIGRPAQFADPRVCHAREGGRLAYDFLRDLGWEERKCRHIRECIVTHRFRSDNPPATMEAKLLFDADKLDVTGALGLARTLAYVGQVGEPLYRTAGGYRMDMDFSREAPHSFLKEYNYKLIRLYDQFCTPEAAEIAQKRKKTMEDFYGALLEEIDLTGMEELLSL